MKNIIKKIIILIFIVAFVAVDFKGAFYVTFAADDASDIKKDMDKIQNQIDAKQKELEAKELENKQVGATISTTSGLIKKTQEEINRKETEIENLNRAIELDKKILKNYIQEMSFGDQMDELLNFIAIGNLLNEFSGNFDRMVSIKEKTLGLIADINEKKEDLGEVKEQLDEKKEDHEKLLAVKQMEQEEIKEDIQDAKTTLSQLNGKLDKLRSRYSEILGISVDTKDVLEAAKFAAKATGIDRSFLLGVLIQESNKGQSTGSCDYKQSRMTDKQLVAFKDICSDLKYDYKKKKVSCPPKSYKGTGGAMGVPQFMPTTWQGWKSRIASATGHSTPNPWSLVDGVTAMALKLSTDGASKKTRFAEAKSYCVYLAGGNWGGYCFGSDKYKKSYEDVNCWGSSIKNYGEKVLCLKDNYEKYY